MIAALILAAASQFGDLTMRVVGPAVAGGRIAGVAGPPQIQKLYYIGTAGGGVWKSENGGATWSPVFDKQDVRRSARSRSIQKSRRRLGWNW